MSPAWSQRLHACPQPQPPPTSFWRTHPQPQAWPTHSPQTLPGGQSLLCSQLPSPNIPTTEFALQDPDLHPQGQMLLLGNPCPRVLSPTALPAQGLVAMEMAPRGHSAGQGSRSPPSPVSCCRAPKVLGAPAGPQDAHYTPERETPPGTAPSPLPPQLCPPQGESSPSSETRLRPGCAGGLQGGARPARGGAGGRGSELEPRKGSRGHPAVTSSPPTGPSSHLQGRGSTVQTDAPPKRGQPGAGEWEETRPGAGPVAPF